MSFIIDAFSLLSIVGIWPRFIEPRLLFTTKLSWELSSHHAHLDGLKIVHLTDLHFHAKTSPHFLDKIVRRIETLEPDLIFFTGDFICYSRLEKAERLRKFLKQLHARYGCFCSFGNHDYASYVSRNKKGVYDTLPAPSPIRGLMRGLKTFFSKSKCIGGTTERARSVPMHLGLIELLKETPFKWLDNETITLPIGLNVTGLGDLALERCQAEKAFVGYHPALPGIILSHNPDTLPLLSSYPGEWILSGHTHGEQIHFPWPKWARRISKKLARLQDADYTRGLYSVGDKNIYVNRGLGCHKPFRFCSPPEICILKAVAKK